MRPQGTLSLEGVTVVFWRHQLVPMTLSCYKEQAEGAGCLGQCKTLYPACLRARISVPRTERRKGGGGAGK